MWKQIINTNYEISSLGEVRNTKTNRILKPSLHYKGYYRVHLKNKWYYIHRLVAEYFIPNPNNKPQIHHIDQVKTNNSISNLQWVTNKENNSNINRSFKYEKDHHNCKISNDQVTEILNSDLSNKELSIKYSVAYITIYKIKKGSRSYLI